MPDNKLFERSIHARTACKSATSSRHRLRFAKRRRPACHRTAGKSTEFHLHLRFRDGPQDTRRTAEEKSMPAIVLRIGPACIVSRSSSPLLRPRATPTPRAKILRSPAASRRALLRQPAAACAIGGGAICSINARKPGNFGSRRKRSNSSRRGLPAAVFGESARAFCNVCVDAFLEGCNAGVELQTLQRRTDKRKSVRWRGGCAGPTPLGSLLGSGSAGDLVIPCAMERPGPRARHVSMNHGAEAALFQNRAHVHVNQEQADA